MEELSPNTLALIALGAHFVASVFNTVVKERWPWVGPIINAFAIGFGRARPDAKKNALKEKR